MHRIIAAATVLVLAATTFARADNCEDKPAPPANKEQDQAQAERAEFLQTVGLLTTAQVYQAYLNVGFVADGKATGAYDEKEAFQILDSVLNLLNASDKQLEKLMKLELSRGDREGLEHLRKLSSLVRQQGEELRGFWKTGDKERSSKYEKLRVEAWDGISKLLGLDKPPKAVP